MLKAMKKLPITKNEDAATSTSRAFLSAKRAKVECITATI